jgi:hypothetical protein
MRAVLFASATATTSGGRRRRSPITHGSALVAFDLAALRDADIARLTDNIAELDGLLAEYEAKR